MNFKTLYTRDANGSVRFWRMEINPADASQYRTVSGVMGGAEVASGWTTATPKNVGRSNETSASQQAILEIEAEMRKKIDRKYGDDPNNVGRHKFFAPMLAHKWEGWTGGPVWVQPKLDGLRCIATASGLTSRQGKPYNLPHIAEALAPLFEQNPDLVLDGELYNHDLKDDFNTLTSLIKRDKRTAEQEQRTRAVVQYHVYDLPSCPGGFRGRATLIGLSQSALKDPLKRVATFKADDLESLDQHYGDFIAEGYEGMMIRLDQPYEVGKRSKSLLKRKDFLDAEFELVSIEEGQGNWAGYAKTAEITLPDGRTQSAGMRGSQAQMAELLKNRDKYSHVTVRYQALTPDGYLRFPVIVDWHEGERAY